MAKCRVLTHNLWLHLNNINNLCFQLPQTTQLIGWLSLLLKSKLHATGAFSYSSRLQPDALSEEEGLNKHLLNE